MNFGIVILENATEGQYLTVSILVNDKNDLWLKVYKQHMLLTVLTTVFSRRNGIWVLKIYAVLSASIPFCPVKTEVKTVKILCFLCTFSQRAFLYFTMIHPGCSPSIFSGIKFVFWGNLCTETCFNLML